MSTEIPVGKLNKWCERRGLASNDEARISNARRYLVNNDLTNYEKAAFYLHEIFDCQGLEFVAFSNARYKNITNLPGNITIVPCFLPTEEGRNWRDPLVRLTFRMVEHARFIYDGWMPISDWNIKNVRKAIQNIDEVLTLFAAQERIWFTWEPKYFPSQLYPSSHNIEDEHIREIVELRGFTETLNEEDLKAFYRSLAWLSQSLVLPQPAARFLFCIISIESLATYIEREATNDSIFFSLKTSYPRTLEEREKCIADQLNQHYTENRINAITQAYVNCVLSINKILKSHLSRIFSDDPDSFKFLFEKDQRESLYDIRHKIAHGGLDILSNFERQKIADRIWDIEKIARKYFINILKLICGKSPFKQIMYKSMFIPMTEAIGSHEGMYQGPIHMAEFYTYIKR